MPSFGMTIFGLGAVYAGQYLPGDFRIGATLVGVGLAGYGAYGLYAAIFGIPEADEKPIIETIPDDQDLEAYRRLLGSITLPGRDGVAERPFLSDYYPIQFTINNQSDADLIAQVRLEVEEFPRLAGAKRTSTKDYVVPVGANSITKWRDPKFPTVGESVVLDAVARLYVVGIGNLPNRQVDNSFWEIK